MQRAAVVVGAARGKSSHLSAGAIVRDIRGGAGRASEVHVVIGAGAVVTKDIINPGVYVGNPAKLLKSLK